MKNVIITGTSRGIGLELLKIFSNNNFNVLSLTRNFETVTGLNLKNVHSFHMDISKEKSIQKAVEEITKRFKKIDVIINNAGCLINKPFLETTFKDFEKVYSVNVFGVAILINQLFKFFDSDANIVNVSSIGGIPGSSKFPGLSAYSSSKAALNLLSEMLAEEFKDNGVKFNNLALGAVQTEMLQEAFPGYKAQISAEKMASYIYKFATEDYKFFNGKTIPISISNP